MGKMACVLAELRSGWKPSGRTAHNGRAQHAAWQPAVFGCRLTCKSSRFLCYLRPSAGVHCQLPTADARTAEGIISAHAGMDSGQRKRAAPAGRQAQEAWPRCDLHQPPPSAAHPRVAPDLKARPMHTQTKGSGMSCHSSNAACAACWCTPPLRLWLSADGQVLGRRSSAGNERE